MMKLITTLICSRLEYAVAVCSPHRKEDLKDRIQRAAMVMVSRLTDLLCKEILGKLRLPSQAKIKNEVTIAEIRAMMGVEKVNGDDIFIWDGEQQEVIA